MPIRVAEIDALAAARPFGAAFDGDVLSIELLLQPLCGYTICGWRSRLISRADETDFLVKQINDARMPHKTASLS
jgi:hypothetical protein